MLDEVRKILDRLDTPADWAIVVGAGTADFVLDGLFNIVAPFTPPVCGMTFASAAFAAKRASDAMRKARREEAARRLAEAARMERLRKALDIAAAAVLSLRAGGAEALAQQMSLEIDLASVESDPERLIQAIRRIAGERGPQ